MGISSDIPGKPFQPLPPAPGMPSSGIAQNANIRGMANTAKQTVSNRQQRFVNMMEGSANGQPNNYSTEMPQMPQRVVQASMKSSEDYVKVGMTLIDRREEIDQFMDWVLYG